MADYTHTTRADAVAAISQRLGDPTGNHWTPPQVRVALVDALRMLNVLTGHDRARGTFQTTEGEPLYLLPTTLQDGSGDYLRAQTVADTTLVDEVKYLLAETTATDQFSSAQIVTALQRSRDELLSASTVVVGRTTIAVDPSGNGLVDLPETVIAVRRAVWIGADGRYSSLFIDDDQSGSIIGRQFTSRGRPSTWSVAATAPNTLRLNPPPSAAGTLELIVVSAGAVFDTTGAASTPVGVPDDLAWVLKMMTTRQLLGDDESYDAARMAAVGQLADMGMEVARNLVVTMNVELAGYPVVPAAISKTDSFRDGWQGRKRGAPALLSIVGPDAVMVTPIPDAGPYAVTMDVVRRMRVPATDADHLQVGREHLDIVYGIAQALLLLKTSDLDASGQLLSGAFRSARRYASRMEATSYAIAAMRKISRKDIDAAPLESDDDQRFNNDPQQRQEETLLERNARRRKT